MKKILIFITCILNVFGMNLPNGGFSDKDIELRLRFSPFERAAAAINDGDHELLFNILSRNPGLLNTHAKSFGGANLLAIAMVLKKDDIARSLISHGNFRDSSANLSALQVAARCGDEELAKLLIDESGSNPDKLDDNGISPLSVSRNKNNKSVFKIYQRHVNGYMADDER
jgi:ankyrin repeat protein